MKKLLFYVFPILIIACSSDDSCESKKEDIRERYEPMIEIARANYIEGGGSREQLDLLEMQYKKELENACN